MDSAGTPTAVGDIEQQMKNAYADLEKVLTHYGYSRDDVTVENVYTTNMAKFLEVSGTYRAALMRRRRARQLRAPVVRSIWNDSARFARTAVSSRR